MTQIAPVRSDADVAAATALAWEFVALLRDRYPERAESIDDYLKEQRFEEMLANFRDFFNPPTGECMLARLDGDPVGIVMLKPVDNELCEMNRMFVQAHARGHGIGRQLCQALFEAARALGYIEMRLGALNRHVEALPLYYSLGFEADPNPPPHAAADPGVISLRKFLTPSETAPNQTGET